MNFNIASLLYINYQYISIVLCKIYFSNSHFKIFKTKVIKETVYFDNNKQISYKTIYFPLLKGQARLGHFV